MKISSLRPKYFIARIRQKIWMIKNPAAPWFSKEAVDFIDQWLLKTDIGIEWGAGRSTFWFAERVNKLVSIEHNPEWFLKISTGLNNNKIENVDLKFIEVNQRIINPQNHDAINYAYLSTIEIDDNSLDFAIIDGLFRDHCASVIINKLKPGGLLFIDDAHRYFSINKKLFINHSSDNSSISEGWQSFMSQVRNWRRICFTDGIYSDALYFKPLS